jgi:hypothetical protein
MSEYLVKLSFWLRAYDSVTIEAATDAEALEKAKAAATALMDSRAQPEAIDMDERREGIIAFIDRVSSGERQAIAEDVAFDDDRIHAAVPDASNV